MTMPSSKLRAEIYRPGEVLRGKLEERGWSQADLADIIGKHANAVSDIIKGKRGISPETAIALAFAFDDQPEFWMALDAEHQLSRVSNNDNGNTITRRAKLFAKAPVKDMVRRGWIEASDDINLLEDQICRFLQIKSIDDEPNVPRHFARKSTTYRQPPTPVQTAWLFRVRQLSRAIHAGPYSDSRFLDAIEKIRLLLKDAQEVRHVPRVLSDAGIRLVVVQPLAGSKIDGACLWEDDKPTVALSLRFDRIDNFWFVLMHELDHVRKHGPSLDTDLEHAANVDDRPEFEREADAFAAETLLPTRQIEGFIARVGPFYSAGRIEAFAHTMGVHPAIVVGQLQHRGEVNYSSYRKLMTPVKELISLSALTDGWGVALPNLL